MIVIKKFIRNNIYIFYTVVLLLHILNVFLQSDVLEYIIGILAIIMIIISFFDASKLFKILSSVFMLFGSFFYVNANIPLYQLPFFMTSNLALLAFFSVLPWINSAVHVGRYDGTISQLIKGRALHLGSLYFRSSFTAYTLVTFLNLSAVDISQNILIKSLKSVKKKISDSFISKVTLRAFSLAIIWSPMEIAVAIMVDYTGVSYLTYLPWLFFISVSVLIIDGLIGRKKYRSIIYSTPYSNRKVPSQQIIVKQIIKLFLVFLLFLTIVVVAGNLFKLNFILTVTLVIIPFSIIWAISMKKWHHFKILGWNVWKRHLNHMQNFMVLFISLSFLTSSLNETIFLQMIQKPFTSLESSPLILFGLIFLTFFVLAMVGVHPIATIYILLEVLAPMLSTLNPLSIGIVLIVTAIATTASGTYGVATIMTSINTKQNLYRITLRNIPFTLLLGSFGIAVAYFLL